jgi:hypothetical protein
MSGAGDWRAQTIDLPHNPATNGLTYLSDLNVSRANQLVNDPSWTKALFVRDPCKRFVSAYYDKIVKHPYYHKRLKLTFPEFVTKVEGGFKDIHWMPQCDVIDCYKWLPEMDFVGRVENAHADAKRLLQRIGAWDDHGATGWGATGNQTIFGTVRDEDHVSGAKNHPKVLASRVVRAKVGKLLCKDRGLNPPGVPHLHCQNMCLPGGGLGAGETRMETFRTAGHCTQSPINIDAIIGHIPFFSCPAGGVVEVVSGQDERFNGCTHPKEQHKSHKVIGIHGNPCAYAERNPKMICNVERLMPPCVVYSLGSYDEISFEVGLFDRGVGCDVHVFDSSKVPPIESQRRYNFTSHLVKISNVDDSNGNVKTVATIMKELGHTFIDVLKIDIEGFEGVVLPHMAHAGTLSKVAIIAPEFHNRDLMVAGFELLTRKGFKPAYHRREDRCASCTESMFWNSRVDSAYWGLSPRGLEVDHDAFPTGHTCLPATIPPAIPQLHFPTWDVAFQRPGVDLSAHQSLNGTLIVHIMDHDNNNAGLPLTSLPFHDLGPSEFLIELVGATLHSAIPRFTGRGVYQHTWVMPRNGTYRMQLRRLRRQWAGVREDRSDFPPMNETLLVDENVSIPWYNASHCGGGHWAIDTVLPPNALSYVKNAPRPAPQLREYNAIPVVRMHNGSYFLYNYRLPCTVPFAGQVDLRAYSILFVGDSHVRTAVVDLLRAYGISVDASMIGKSEDKCFKHAGGHRWCYSADVFGNRVCSLLHGEWAVIVANFGQWHASSQRLGDATYNLYRRAVDAVVRCVAGTLLRFVWLEVPPLPMDVLETRPGAWPDWRTYQRLCAFNNYATLQFERKGVAVFRHFASKLSLVSKQRIPRGGHFTVQGMNSDVLIFLQNFIAARGGSKFTDGELSNTA